MRHEIGECHLARKDERNRAGEQADQQQEAANGFEDRRQSDQ